MGRIKSPLGFITSSLSREVYVRPRGQGAAELSEGDKESSPSLRVSSAAWQRESGRSRTRAAGAPHVGGSSRSSFGVGGARATRQSSVENS